MNFNNKKFKHGVHGVSRRKLNNQIITPCSSVSSVVLFLLLFVFVSPLFSQTQTVSASRPWWLFLEQGKTQFRNQNYGSALMLFEDARRSRRAMYEQMERDLINFLSINEVRRIGDTLDFVERYARDRHHLAAARAFDELYYRVPKESLNNSATKALETIGRLKDYPEAEFWIGEVYRVEGELTLALLQFRRAYEMRDLCEIPGFGIDLQYRISSILQVRQEYSEMERILLSIINEHNNLWATRTGGLTAVNSFAAESMGRTLESEGINRFLIMYRYNNRIVEPAHRRLGFHYAVRDRQPAQQHLMFAFLIQNTIIIEEVTRHRFDFSFTTLDALTQEIRRNQMLSSFVQETEYYKTAYYLAYSLFANGRLTAANGIWRFLSAVSEAGEWQSRAASQLINPRREPVAERP